MVASASMKWLTVEPVPTPTMLPSTTYGERGVGQRLS
jgi:hypothetical protein